MVAPVLAFEQRKRTGVGEGGPAVPRVKRRATSVEKKRSLVAGRAVSPARTTSLSAASPSARTEPANGVASEVEAANAAARTAEELRAAKTELAMLRAEAEARPEPAKVRAPSLVACSLRSADG